MYKKVLVPLDGSELAECALAHVKNLVKEGAVGEVVLLNVAGVDISWSEIDQGIDIGGIRQKLLDASRQYLADIQSRLRAEGLKVETALIEANRPAHVIADYVQKNHVDLIVIATHGYTGMKKMLLGSVALKVLHESQVPVLLIRPASCQ